MAETSILPTSILESVKKVLGLAKDYVSFDVDIVTHINTVFSNLTQMGIGPIDGFAITGYTETWDLYTTSDPLKTRQIQSYIPLKVKTMFDPSANSNVSEAINKSILEMEYRLYIEEENSRYEDELLEEEVVIDE